MRDEFKDQTLDIDPDKLKGDLKNVKDKAEGSVGFVSTDSNSRNTRFEAEDH